MAELRLGWSLRPDNLPRRPAPNLGGGAQSASRASGLALIRLRGSFQRMDFHPPDTPSGRQPNPIAPPKCVLPEPFSATATNGRETLGLRPALRQAAPGVDEVGGGEERQRRGNGRSHNRPPSGDSLREFVLHSLGGKAGAACLRDIPFGNVVSRWTLADIPDSYLTHPSTRF